MTHTSYTFWQSKFHEVKSVVLLETTQLNALLAAKIKKITKLDHERVKIHPGFQSFEAFNSTILSDNFQ